MTKKYKVNKSFKDINEKIKSGKVVVVTAEEIIDIVEKEGPVKAAEKVDVVTTGTFAPMCSSGAFLSLGHSQPGTKISETLLNNVPAYSGIAAVDCYIGATEPCLDDPLNKVHPGEFNYGGGHVLQDLVAGKEVYLDAKAYGTTCYPSKEYEKKFTLDTIPNATLCNPRNGYQNYNCAVNLTKKTIYTYMGTLKPKGANANYCSSGELSPLFNDPLYKTIGMGTRIFLGGGVGYITFDGTQHKPDVERTKKGIPCSPAGTLFVMGDLKQMNEEFLMGVSLRGYGCSLSVGLGIPIPILNEEMAEFTSISDKDIYTNVVDYGNDYPKGISNPLRRVSYAELKSGSFELNGKTVQTAPLSSMVKARKIAESLKEWISEGKFFLGEPQFNLTGPMNMNNK